MTSFSAQHPLAFFCAEYGLEARLPFYAGGLGILAGDILKEAADQQIPLVALGLLYRGVGAGQMVNEDGEQIEINRDFDPLSAGLEHVYLEDETPLFVKVHLTQVDVWLRCWKKQLGETVTLYLLDTATDQNLPEERNINDSLYTGTEEALIKQQLLLGIGGVKVLHALNIHPALYHVNEGRPAFLHWQLIRSYMDEHGMTYQEAHKLAKSKTVYTNHTLVGAGNQPFNIDILRAYSHYYADKIGISVDELLQLGMVENNQFSMTQFALNSAERVSAVSQLHYRLCQKAWPDFKWVGITNGVHLPTWQDQDIKALADTPGELWRVHQKKKQQLMEFVQQRTGFGYDPNRLVISWARRVTGYKQLNQLFEDVERLRNILSAEGREVQLLIAGKAHAYDKTSKQLITTVIKHLADDLPGYALYIPNYDMEVSRHLISGSDVWLNTPEYGMEACGTSGMKAISNGVLQCTVKDGWAAEVEWPGIGWELDAHNVATSLYDTLENEIVPTYWQRDEEGVPQAWVERMQKSIVLAERFSASRMMKEYLQRLYYNVPEPTIP